MPVTNIKSNIVNNFLLIVPIPFHQLQKQNPKILLIHPNLRYVGTDTFPLGLGYIASYLKQYSTNLIIYDEQKYQMGRQQLDKIKPAIIGISATSPSFPRVQKFIKSVKTIPEHIRPLIIMGGVHATYCPEEVLHSGVDIVFRSESDASINKLFSKKPNSYQELFGIPGLSWLDDFGIFQQTNSPEPVPSSDMDLIPFPARELFDASAGQEIP